MKPCGSEMNRGRCVCVWGGVPLASRGGERTVIEVTLGKAAALGYNEG